MEMGRRSKRIIDLHSWLAFDWLSRLRRLLPEMVPGPFPFHFHFRSRRLDCPTARRLGVGESESLRVWESGSLGVLGDSGTSTNSVPRLPRCHTLHHGLTSQRPGSSIPQSSILALTTLYPPHSGAFFRNGTQSHAADCRTRTRLVQIMQKFNPLLRNGAYS